MRAALAGLLLACAFCARGAPPGVLLELELEPAQVYVGGEARLRLRLLRDLQRLLLSTAGPRLLCLGRSPLQLRPGPTDGPNCFPLLHGPRPTRLSAKEPGPDWPVLIAETLDAFRCFASSATTNERRTGANSTKFGVAADANRIA